MQRVLELACGPAPYLPELCRRGYEYHGLDINSRMLQAAKKKVCESEWVARFHEASMIEFAVDEPFEFLFVPLGSLYVRSSADLEKHFASVAGALKPGGLYMLDWCVQFGLSATYGESGQGWQMNRDGVAVDVNVRLRDADPVAQVISEELILEVDDRGKAFRLKSTDHRRAIFPQEFLLLVDTLDDFEFVGWWNDWDFDQPLNEVSGEISRPVVFLRRTGY